MEDDGLMEIGENLPGQLFDGFRPPRFEYVHIEISPVEIYSSILCRYVLQAQGWREFESGAVPRVSKRAPHRDYRAAARAAPTSPVVISARNERAENSPDKISLSGVKHRIFAGQRI